MPSTETSPEPLNRVRSSGSDDSPAPDPGASTPSGLPTDDDTGFAQLFRELAEDTRTLVQQEIELFRLEVAHSAKRVARDGAWIWAGGVAVTVALLCLALAVALGVGELLNSYWLGALITAGAFLLIGGLLAWRGIRDLRSGDLLPSNPLDSLQESRDWARQEVDDLKKGITEDT